MSFSNVLEPKHLRELGEWLRNEVERIDDADMKMLNLKHKDFVPRVNALVLDPVFVQLLADELSVVAFGVVSDKRGVLMFLVEDLFLHKVFHNGVTIVRIQGFVLLAVHDACKVRDMILATNVTLKVEESQLGLIDVRFGFLRLDEAQVVFLHVILATMSALRLVAFVTFFGMLLRVLKLTLWAYPRFLTSPVLMQLETISIHKNTQTIFA